MLRNILLITFRNFLRNWNHTLINVLGLSVGIASCVIIFLVVNNEFQFDKFHSQYNKIYRVIRTTEAGGNNSAVTPYPFIHAFHQDFPDIPLATQFHYSEENQLTYGAERMKVQDVVFADSLFFNVFDFEVLEGNPNVELGQPGKVFLTQSLAEKILKPDGGRTIRLDGKFDMEVVGIVKDPPASSHIHFEMIVSMPSLSLGFVPFPVTAWGGEMAGFTYVVLPENIQRQDLTPRFADFVSKYFPKEDGPTRVYKIQALSDIHFNEDYAKGPSDVGGISKSNLLILGLLGAFLLAIACINFVNLSTALAVRKSREIGVRKTLGASRLQLTRQFMMEAFLITAFSLLVALVQVEFFLPWISEFLSKSLTLTLTDEILLPFLAGLLIVTTILAGGYPSWILSRFNPVAVLKNKLTSTTTSGGAARKYLVTFQFLIAQILIIGTLVVSSQMEYFQSKSLGFTKESIVNVKLPQRDREKWSAFKSHLLGVAGIDKVSFSLGGPISKDNFFTTFYLTEQGSSERLQADMKPVDLEYAETYGLQIAAGRWFNPSEEIAGSGFDKNDHHRYVVNEALVSKLGFSSNEEIVGKKITTGLNSIDGEVIGVVRDFHTTSLHQEVGPTILIQFPYLYYDAGILFSGNVTDVMKGIEKSYSNVYPDFVFEYSFLDQHIESLYKDEKRAFGLVQIFAGLSILISCLGLLGLVSFITQQKIKEIGIRKVFGATVASIVILFTKGFAVLIGISFLIAAPLGWYLMNGWLEGFAYRTTIGWEVFVIAIGLTTLIAMLTVGYQSVKAAITNPAHSLRSE